MGIFVGVLGCMGTGFLLLGLPVLALVVVRGEFGLVGGPFVLVGVALVAGAWALYRRSRGRVAKFLELRIDPQEVRRGDRVHVTLRITDAGEAVDRVDVGVVCTEYYDHRVQSGDGRSGRGTGEAVAFERWERASSSATHQSFTFNIPADAPFSYEGSAVSYAWKASARIPQAMRSDPARHRPLWVLR